MHPCHMHIHTYTLLILLYIYTHAPSQIHQDLAGMAILCCDKTGTLTLNKMVIQAETSLYTSDLDQTLLLRYAAVSIYMVYIYDVCTFYMQQYAYVMCVCIMCNNVYVM